jgi:hypothetical protein
MAFHSLLPARSEEIAVSLHHLDLYTSEIMAATDTRDDRAMGTGFLHGPKSESEHLIGTFKLPFMDM